MAPGRRTDLPTAAAIVALKQDYGLSNSQIAENLDVADSTVRDIAAGLHGWDRILANSSVFAEHRSRQKKILQAASINLAHRCLEQAEKKVDQASAYQAVGMYALLRDKERLDAGESTQNISVISKSDAGSMEQAIERLARIARERRGGE